MELRHIRYFLMVAEEGNFTRAAERLGIGQPPLSQQIQNLEAEIGFPLFRRLAHGAELSAAGQAFLREVKIFPQMVQNAINAAQKAARGESGNLRLGLTGATALNPHIPAAIRDFRNLYPAIDLHLEEANGVVLINDLLEWRLDVALFRSSAKDPVELQIIRLGHEELIVALPANHRLAQDDKAINIKDLQREPLILTPRAMGTSLHDATIKTFRDAGFEPNLGQPAPHIASIIAMVSAELGVALVPKSSQQLALNGVKFMPLCPPVPQINLIIAYRKDNASAVVKNFVNLVRQIFKHD